MQRTDLGGRFWQLWAAFSATNLADGFTVVTFPLLAASLSRDPRAVAVVIAARFLPFLLIGLPAGVVLDRVDRRVASFLALTARASTMAALAFAVAGDRATIPVLALAAFVIGAGEIVADAGIPAMVQAVVESAHLEVANSRISAAGTATNVIVGPVIGAGFAGIEPSLATGTTAALYALSAAIMLTLRGDYKPEPDVETAEATDEAYGHPAEVGRFTEFRRDLTTGLRYVWGHALLRPMALAVATFAFFGQACNAVFVLVVQERFGYTGTEFGVLVALEGVSALIMSFFVARIVRRTSHSFSMRFSIVTSALAALSFGLSPLLGAAVLSRLLYGVSAPSWTVITATVRQRLVPPDLFGRMMTAYLLVAWGTMPFGSMFGGFIGRLWGPESVYVIAGIGTAVLLIVLRPMLAGINAAMAEDQAIATS